MFVRSVIVAAGLLAATGPGLAETMNAEAARRFVAGKLFAFNCFDGSTGSGRIFNDGSVAGVVRMRGNGNTRFMHMPPGTLFPKGEAICSHVKGAFFNPCFNLTKTGAQQLPRRGLGLRLCVLRLPAPRRRTRDGGVRCARRNRRRSGRRRAACLDPARQEGDAREARRCADARRSAPHRCPRSSRPAFVRRSHP